MISIVDGKTLGKSRIHIEGSPNDVVNEWANITRELICLLVKDYDEEAVKEEMKRIFKEARKDGIKQARGEN